MSTNVKISADLTGKKVDPTLYRSKIRSLLYLTASRPDIAFSVGVCALFPTNPKESQFTTAKRIIRYVNDTILHGIWYSRKQILWLQVTLMQIGLAMRMTERVLLEDVLCRD
jgi:hypothetical protein